MMEGLDSELNVDWMVECDCSPPTDDVVELVLDRNSWKMRWKIICLNYYLLIHIHMHKTYKIKGQAASKPFSQKKQIKSWRLRFSCAAPKIWSNLPLIIIIIITGWTFDCNAVENDASTKEEKKEKKTEAIF